LLKFDFSKLERQRAKHERQVLITRLAERNYGVDLVVISDVVDAWINAGIRHLDALELLSVTALETNRAPRELAQSYRDIWSNAATPQIKMARLIRKAACA
jgi:hypothetical protein